MTRKEFDEYIDSLNKEPEEYTDDDLYEIGLKFKELPTSEKRWNDLVDLLEVDKTGEQFRIWIKDQQYARGEMKKNIQLLSGKTVEDLNFPEAEQKLEEIKNDLYVQQTKTRDQRNSLRRTLRDEARIEDIKDLIAESIKELKPLKFSGSYTKAEEGKEAVLLFSDLHIGAIFEGFYNSYNNEIARARVEKLVNDTIALCKMNKVQRLNFCSMGDLIHGSLRVSSRVENNEDRTSEVMEASEIMANALAKLAENIPEVVYRSTFGNHDRMTPNYHEHIEKESFCKLIDWYLEARLKDSKVIFMKDNLDDTIGLFKLLNNKNFAFVHGDKDKNVTGSLFGLSNHLNEKIHYFALGHLHSTGLSTIQGTTIFRNGSILGVDDYATSIRAFGPAAQTLLLFDGTDNVMNVTIDLQNI